MRILFDQNVPVGVRKVLRRAGHEVVTSPDLEWEELKNGVLLKAAEEAHFDLMVTADQDLTYQQNLTGRKIALIVLGSNDWYIVRQHMDKITTAAQAAVMNSYAFYRNATASETALPASAQRVTILAESTLFFEVLFALHHGLQFAHKDGLRDRTQVTKLRFRAGGCSSRTH